MSSKITSLSQQLKKLQVPQTQWLLNTEKQRRVSFLYDPKDAANLDSEAVYCLAINGLEQLKLIDASIFETFENTLFSTTTITFERSVQTKDENNKLNDEIKRFLLNISPYFLLKATHKTIEWLVYKFKIHLYNIDELMMCIMPYHENNYFVRALQMLDIEQSQLWSWLSNNKTTGVVLSSSTLATHILHDLSFLNFLVSYVNECLAIYSADSSYVNGLNLCTSFMTKCLTQTITQQQANLNDNFLAQLLPFVYKCLKPKQPSEIKQFAYLITTLICQKCVLNKTTIEKILNKLIKSIKKQEENEIFKTFLLAVCLVIQSQYKHVNKDLNKITDNTNNIVDHLNQLYSYFNTKFLAILFGFHMDSVLATIVELNDEYEVNEFLECLLIGLTVNLVTETDETDECSGKRERFLIDLFKQINLNGHDDLIRTVLESVLRLLEHVQQHQLPHENALNKIVKLFELKYPSKFDSILNGLLNDDSLSIKLSNLDIMNLTVNLQHNNDNMRAKAIDYLYESLNKQKDLNMTHIREQLDVKFQHETSPVVLKSLLKLDKHLLKFFDKKDILHKVYANLFVFNGTDTWTDPNGVLNDANWTSCRKLALNLLFNQLYEPNDNDYARTFFKIVCFLFESKSIELVIYLKEIRYLNECFDFFRLVADMSPVNNNTLGGYFECFHKYLIANARKLEYLFGSVDKQTKQVKFNLEFLLKLDLSMELSRHNPNYLNSAFEFIQLATAYIPKVQKKFNVADPNTRISSISLDCMQITDGIDVQLYAHYASVFMHLLNMHDSQTLREKFFEFLCLKSNKNQLFIQLLRQFVDVHLGQTDLYYRFLFKFLTRTPSTVPCNTDNGLIDMEVVRLRCLHLFNVYFDDKPVFASKSLLDDCLLILISALTNKFQTVRNESIKCLMKISQCLKDTNNGSWHGFVKKMLKHKEEIQLDSNYVHNGKYMSKLLASYSDLVPVVLDAIKRCGDKHVLNAYLQLFQFVNDDIKVNFIQDLIDLLQANNDQADETMIMDTNNNEKTNEYPITSSNNQIILSAYLIHTQSAAFFNQNEGHFEKYLIANLTTDYKTLIIDQLVEHKQNFYASLNKNLKLGLINKLFELLNEKKNLQYNDLLVNLIDNFDDFVQLFAKYVPNMPSQQPMRQQEHKTAKELKKHMETDESAIIHEPINVNLLKNLIDLIQIKLVKLNDNEDLGQCQIINHLFNCLNLVFNRVSVIREDDALNETIFDFDYIQIAILNSLINIYKKTDRIVLLNFDKSFNIDLLIQILKYNNINIQKEVLLLLSQCTELYTDKIFDNILTMFVFVGNKLARKDDAYSIDILNKTINTILPIVLKARSNIDSQNVIPKILQSFIITIPHIPAHRKFTVFHELLNIVDINSYLWLAIIQAFDSVLVQETNVTRDSLKSCLTDYTQLYVQFKPNCILQSILSLVEFLNAYMSMFMQQQKSELNTKFAHLACQFSEYTNIKHKYMIYNLIVFINDLLMNDNMQANLIGVYKASKNADMDAYSRLFELLMENILYGVLSVNKLQSLSNIVDDDAKYLRAILNKYYDMLEGVLNNLNSKLFISIISKLIKHEQYQIKRRVLNILNNKLRKLEPNENEITLLLGLSDNLLDAIQLPLDEQLVDIEINNQQILFTIKLLCKRIGDTNPYAFMKILKFICENLIDPSLFLKSDSGNKSLLKNTNLLSSILLCLGELCSKLKTSSLVYLNRIIKFVLDLLINQEDVLNYDLFLLSSITCLLKIVQNLCTFLSPYLQQIINVSCSLLNQFKQKHSLFNVYQQHSHTISISSDIGMDIDALVTQHTQNMNTKVLTQLDMKLSQLRNCLALNVPLRLLTPILNDESLKLNDYIKIDNIEYYMQLAKVSIKNSVQEDLLANIRLLRTMFMNLFNFRTMNALFKSPNDLCKNEDHIIDAYCELTFKLSEETFRPIFFKFYEWATINEPPKDRLITFYRTTYKLSNKLKNLFILFSTHFIQNAAGLLDTLNVSKKEENFFLNKKERTKYVYANEKLRLLLFSIMDTMANLFLHDSDKFMTTNDRFNLIMQPLVDQIENEIQFDNYKTYINDHVVPCISNFALLCTYDVTLCKKLNYQILLKTKHSSAQVRLAALDVLNKVSKQMSDVYNAIFTETAPFLAELMEDPIQEVEEKVQFVIRELEDMLGESLQGHFV